MCFLTYPWLRLQGWNPPKRNAHWQMETRRTPAEPGLGLDFLEPRPENRGLWPRHAEPDRHAAKLLWGLGELLQPRLVFVAVVFSPSDHAKLQMPKMPKASRPDFGRFACPGGFVEGPKLFTKLLDMWSCSGLDRTTGTHFLSSWTLVGFVFGSEWGAHFLEETDVDVRVA